MKQNSKQTLIAHFSKKRREAEGNNSRENTVDERASPRATFIDYYV